MPKKPAPKECTHTEAFQLETDRRIRERQANRKPEEPQEQTFRPRPVPLRILEEVVVRTSNPLQLSCLLRSAASFVYLFGLRVDAHFQSLK